MNIKILLILAIIGILSGLYSASYYNQKKTPEEPLIISYNPYDAGVYAAGTVENDSSANTMVARCFVNSRLVPDLPKNFIAAAMFLRGKNTAPIPLEFVGVESYVTSSSGNQMLPIVFKFKKNDYYNISAGQAIDVYIKGDAI